MTASREPGSTEPANAREIRAMLLDALHAMQSLDMAERATTSGEAPESLVERLLQLPGSMWRLGLRATDTSLRVGRALVRSQDQLRAMLLAGQSLKDIREVAGLTLAEMSEALNLKDKSVLEAIENGTATLSFELILRLAALIARNDPIPFILRTTRNYNPDVWRILDDWGIGKLPLQFEREREFINIFRSHDDARNLSDEGFRRVLEFTRQSFEMSLHFVEEQERQLRELRQQLTDLEPGPGRSPRKSGGKSAK